jgi:hypothetical protein
MYNIIVDTIEKQAIMRSKEQIEELKKHERYYSKDKLSFTKAAQRKLNEEFEHTNWDLAYAISAGKTIPKPYYKIHWCAKHGVPANKNHLEECNVLKTSDAKKPNHYNNFW